jgi:precorrin-6B methylase 2
MLFREIYKIVKRHVSYCLYSVLLVLKEYGFEKKHRISISGAREGITGKSANGDASAYEGITYDNLQKIFDYLRPTANDVFVDFGCGLGRVTCFAALQNLKKVYGVELVKEYADAAKRNARSMQPKPAMPVEIIEGDALNAVLHDVTIYYFYNPFGIKTFTAVLDRIRSSLAKHPRRIRVVYVHPLHEWLLTAAGWLQKEHTIIGTSAVSREPVTISVWHNDPAFNYRNSSVKRNAQAAAVAAAQ